jgi:hypothetical protein
MPDAAQHPVQAVPDHRRPQMTHMHLLGDVRRRVVDHHDLGIPDPIHADLRVRQLLGHGLRQHAGLEPQVDEAGSGDLGRLAEVCDLQPGDDVGGDLAWWLALAVRQP